MRSMVKSFWVTSLILAALTGLIGVGHADLARDALRRGQELHAQGKIAEATQALKWALTLDPECARAWMALAFVLKDQPGRGDEAVAAMRKVVELRPDDPEVWAHLGVLLQNYRKWDEAAEAYRRVTILKPKAVQGWRVLANVLMGYRPEEALAAVRRVIELEPTARSWLHYGIILQHGAKRPAEAEQAYRKALELSPKQLQGWWRLGEALSDQGKLEAALAAFETHVSLVPDDALAWRRIGEVLYEQKKLYAASKAFRRAVELDPKYGPWSKLGITLYDMGHALASPGLLQEAVAAFDRTLSVYPQESKVRQYRERALTEAEAARANR